MKYFIGAALFLFSMSNCLAASWSHGKIDMVESFSDHVIIRWNGPNTESCGTSNNVRFDANTLGSASAFDRAFSLVLAAAASGKPIRLRLDGCDGARQKATIVQYCSNDTCSYQ